MVCCQLDILSMKDLSTKRRCILKVKATLAFDIDQQSKENSF